MEDSRKKLTKALVAAIIVIGSILSLGIKFIADDAALSVDRPVFVKTTPDDKLSIQIGNALFFIDKDGNTNNVFNFNETNFYLRGDHAFFSNGDLLFYSSNAEPTILEKLSQFARIKETRQIPVSGNDGLYRCDIKTKNCKIFSTDLPAFYSTFRVEIDRTSDTVYIADTPRFVIYKLDKNGSLLAKNSDDLHFPNQIFLHNNDLYIANTNRHSVRRVMTDNESFGTEISTHETIINKQNTWPTEVIKTPANWWVGIADGSMANSRIQLFDNDWNITGTPLLQDSNAESRSMALFGDEVWVIDWLNIKIYRFNLSGSRLNDFTNKEIKQKFTASNRLLEKYKTISSNGLVAFFVVFIMGLTAAFVLEKEDTLNLFKKHEDKPDSILQNEKLETPPGEGVYWIETRLHKYKIYILIFIIPGLLLSIWPITRILFYNNDTNWPLAFVLLLTYPLMALIFWTWHRMSITKIGVSGELLLIDDGNGNVGAGKGDLIKYSKNILLVNNVIAILGQPHSPVFPAKEIKQWVYPRMLAGQSVGLWAIYKIMWQQKHPAVFTAAGILGYVTLVLLIINNF